MSAYDASALSPDALQRRREALRYVTERCWDLRWYRDPVARMVLLRERAQLLRELSYRRALPFNWTSPALGA